MKESSSRLRQPDYLPDWFVRPTQRTCVQSTLFPEEVGDVLVRLKVSRDELDRWFAYGWVSFGPDVEHKLEPDEVDEIVFVRDLVRSGLPDAYQKALLCSLPKPLSAHPDKIAYSFTLGWVLPAFTRKPDLSEYMARNIDAWIEKLAEERDRDCLVDLKERIDKALDSIENETETE